MSQYTSVHSIEGEKGKKNNKDCMKERKMCETGPVWVKTLLGRCWGSNREGEIQSEEKNAKARRKWNTRSIAVAAEETEGSKAWKRQRISDEKKKARKRPKPTKKNTSRKYFPGEDCSSSVWYCFIGETNLYFNLYFKSWVWLKIWVSGKIKTLLSKYGYFKPTLKACI